MPQLPLIHRTGKTTASWKAALDDGHLTGKPPDAHEKGGWEEKDCTFLGTATYPPASRIAFVFTQDAIAPGDSVTSFEMFWIDS